MNRKETEEKQERKKRKIIKKEKKTALEGEMETDVTELCRVKRFVLERNCYKGL